MFIVSSIAHQGLLWSAGAGMALAIVPWLYVQRKRWIRLRKIERQLPEALDLLTRALRSGHAFSSALQMLGEEMAEPIAGEFRIVRDEVNFGVALSQALMNLCERVPVTDLRYFVVSVLIQRDSGGNLTEVLSNLSRLIRERMKLFGKIRVLSSEGRLSAWILGLMPLGMVALLEFANPEFIEPLWTDPIGIAIVKTLVVLMAIGVLVLIKIIRIRV
jgi:tight adherence protein B